MIDKLTRRQNEIIKLLSVGKNTSEIAVELGISKNTVRRHLSDIYYKLNISSQVQAATLFLSVVQANHSKPITQASKLSQREQQVLDLYKKGLPIKQIALKLGIGQSTASEYLRRAKRKTNEQ